jgi:predicted amidohydrolase
MNTLSKICSLLFFCLFITSSAACQPTKKANIAVIQATGMPRQDPFMGDYDPGMVRPQMMAHFDKLLGLFEEAGEMGADLVCGPEDMQHIGGYGLHVDVMDPETGKILWDALAVPVPGPLTDQVSEIAKKYNMYIIAPIYEADGDRTYNTAVVFNRKGKIIGKHRKTILPIDFANVAIATCWELFYPEITTIYALKGADIIFNPTMGRDNLPGKSLSTAHMYITRARDNSVYIAPVILGEDGNGIIDFDGNVIAEAVGEKDVVIMTEIDFARERIQDSKWWETINGTNNIRAIHYKSRRPEIYQMLTDPNPPILDKYKDIHLTTGDRERQLKAVREVDYGPNKK